MARREYPPMGLSLPVDIKSAEMYRVGFRLAASIILDYEYLGTMPSGFRRAYGIFWGGHCGGVIVLGSPNPMQIANSLFGGQWTEQVMQVHRGACVWWSHEHSASRLIGYAIRDLSRSGKWRAVVAFADPDAGEIGTVYQATNWLYCGMTEKRPDYFDNSGNRMVGHFKADGLTRGERTRKRRYVIMLGDKRKKRESVSAMRWPVLPYDKRDINLPDAGHSGD